MVHRSTISDSAAPWTAACRAPLSIGFPRQEYWSGLPFPSPDYLPDSGIESVSPALPADFLLLAILVQMLLLFMVIPRRTEILLHSKISQETNYIKNFQKFGRRD